MNSLKNSKAHLLSKALATNIIFIWFFCSMNSPMNCKIRSVTKGFATYISRASLLYVLTAWWSVKTKRALKVSHPHYISMVSVHYVLMNYKAPTPTKDFATLLISVTFLSSVNSLMNSVGSRREELRPWQRSWGRKLGIRKGVIKPQEKPCSQASNPKTRVLTGSSPP